MSLLTLWLRDPEQLETKNIQQIIAFAGDGKLRDGSLASEELREFLAHTPLTMIERYASECLQTSFPESGLALQDLVNQIGARLGFLVEEGRYRGVRGEVGFDGLWKSQDGRSIIVEVKTTDTYRIELSRLANYRRELIRAGKATESDSSILIVVGREDTGDLEAQVRGSRFAWDIRLISIQALLKLSTLKERLEDPRIVQQIRSILTPQEFTRVDGIIDVVFLAAEDASLESSLPDDEIEGGPSDEDPGNGRSPKFEPVDFNDACIERIKKYLHHPLVKQSRVTWMSPDGSLGVVCKASRTYERARHLGYWFAFHSTRYQILNTVRDAYVSFGCGSPENVLLIPYAQFQAWSEGLNITRMDNDEFYWHVRIHQTGGRYWLKQRKGYKDVELTSYLLKS